MNGLHDFFANSECGLRVLLRMYMEQIPAPSISFLACR
jgi:hypothetical protein